jgi:hypothetical protein
MQISAPSKTFPVSLITAASGGDFSLASINLWVGQ